MLWLSLWYHRIHKRMIYVRHIFLEGIQIEFNWLHTNIWPTSGPGWELWRASWILGIDDEATKDWGEWSKYVKIGYVLPSGMIFQLKLLLKSGIFQPPLMSRKSSEMDPQKLNVNRIISVISQVFCSCCVSSSLVLNIPILAQIWSIVDTVLICSMHYAVFWLSVYNVCKKIRKHPFGNGL